MNQKKSQHSRKAIDWRAIENQMAEITAAVEQAWEPSPEEARKILQARAEALAEEPFELENATRNQELVEFKLAYERYAFELRYVREVCSLESLTPLPCTPDFVLGVINLRGEILSVIDLKKFFDLPDKGLTDLNKVIVLQSPDMIFGILADEIIGTHAISSSSIQASLPILSGIREAFLQGITSDRTVIIDAEKLLASKNLIVLEQVTG